MPRALDRLMADEAVMKKLADYQYKQEQAHIDVGVDYPSTGIRFSPGNYSGQANVNFQGMVLTTSGSALPATSYVASAVVNSSSTGKT